MLINEVNDERLKYKDLPTFDIPENYSINESLIEDYDYFEEYEDELSILNNSYFISKNNYFN